MNKVKALTLLALLTASTLQAAVSTFEETTLAPASHWGGSNLAGDYNSTVSTGFSSGNAYYPLVSETWSWSGCVYSNETDMTTADYTNQFSAYIAGAQGNSSGNQFAVTYPSGNADVSLTGSDYNSKLSGMWVTNTSYTYLSMNQGDGFAKKFGGATGNDQDWFKLSVTGLTAAGATTQPVEFYLADFRFADNSQDYIIDTWTWFDLSSLGEVVGLSFALSSTDNGKWGMNTPGYFAFDNFNGSALAAPIVPEPATMSLLAGGLVMLGRRMKKLA